MKENYDNYKQEFIYVLRMLNSCFVFPKKFVLMHDNIFLRYKIANIHEKDFKIGGTKEKDNKFENKFISIFITDFKKHIPDEHLIIGIKNIKPINCYSDTFINYLFSLMCIGGLYNGKTHSIFINTMDKHKEVLYHELLHAMTSFKCGSLFISGFSHKNIGYGLNEGYTDLITNRLLNNSVYDYKIGYPYESIVSRIIELIIGKEKMYSLYFKGDLSGLIDTLSQYLHKSDVMNFMINLDKINHISYLRLVSSIKDLNEDTYLNNLYNQITLFLYKLLSGKFNECCTFDDINSYLHISKEAINLIQLLSNYTTFEREKNVIK